MSKTRRRTSSIQFVCVMLMPYSALMGCGGDLGAEHEAISKASLVAPDSASRAPSGPPVTAGAGAPGSAITAANGGAPGNAMSAPTGSPNPPTPPNPPWRSIDERRSLAVTEQAIVSRFSLERVLGQLVAESGVPGLTATQLFQQWWDTQNPGPGLGFGPHCDDQSDYELGTVINGYPYLCRAAPAEGDQASCDPFAAESSCAYIPIGLFNRFDLAPEDGSHCGEYRIIFAKESGISEASNRATVIFEAVLPNPNPQLGLRGCQQIVQFWSNLSNQPSLSQRADALEAFYFSGRGNIPPVILPEHLGAGVDQLGQVRTNQFVQTTTGWSLREFKLQTTCTSEGCSALTMVPVTNKGNAYGGLFSPNVEYENSQAFRDYFPSQVAALAATPNFDQAVPAEFNTAQSQASGTTAYEMKYVEQLGPDPSELRSAIESELLAIGSTLSVEQLVRRSQTLTCAGCHRLSRNADLGGGLSWRSDLGFVHVSEQVTEVVDGELRYGISSVLEGTLLPGRKALMENFLNNKPLPPSGKGPKQPVIGHSHHG